MKGLTKIVTASALGLSLSVSAIASTGAQNFSSVNQSTSDLSYAFADSENLQVKSISSQEMEATEGAWVQYAGAGMVGGYFGYMGYTSSVPKSQRNIRGYATSIGSGAVGGALTLTPIGATRAAFVGGTVGFAGNQAAVKMSNKAPVRTSTRR